MTFGDICHKMAICDNTYFIIKDQYGLVLYESNYMEVTRDERLALRDLYHCELISCVVGFGKVTMKIRFESEDQ